MATAEKTVLDFCAVKPDDPIMVSCRLCLQKIKAERGWTNEETAAALGIVYDTMNKVMTGITQRPSADFVIGLHRLARVSLDAAGGIVTEVGGEDLRQSVRSLEAQVKMLWAVVGGDQAEVVSAGLKAEALPVGTPRELLQGIGGPAKAGAKRAAAAGRKKDEALRTRTAAREEEVRRGRKKSA